MEKKYLEILTNIIGAVESGGQIYGNRRYDAYAGKGANSSNEKTCTLGWAQNYGNEGRKLCRMILSEDPEAFRRADTAGIEGKLNTDWVAAGWNPNAGEKTALIAIITTDAGKRCQDKLFEDQMETYIDSAVKYGVTDVAAQMMWCEIYHMGGYGPTKRIFSRAAKPYTPDSIYASLMLDQNDTSNDNQVGDKMYKSRHDCCVRWIKQYVIDAGIAETPGTTNEAKEETNVAHYISNSGKDERGTYSGGQAGDQTGGEWQLRTWYNRPWNCVLRHPNANVRNKIAELAEKAAKNDKIGYDQSQRNTYWDQLQKVGYDPSKITVACEADCSSGVIANTKAVGFLLGIAALKNIGATYTGNMRSAYQSAGFQVLTASKYLNSPDYLEPGDILLNDASHTATNITRGSRADGGNAPVSTSGGGTSSAAANVKTNYIPGTCGVTLNQFLVGAVHPQVKVIQMKLNSLGYKGKDGKVLDVDGELGENTAYAITNFQKAKGMKNINFGTVAGTTWQLLLNA